jgi:SNF2 family DNA or RNA helicase
MSEILRERYKEFNPAVIHGDIDANGKTENQAIRILKQSWGEKWYKLSSDDQKKLISETMTSERQREVYRFQNDSSCKLFIGCSAACREGLTLTAATHVIFLDVEWAWDYVVQAFSRAHRIGQKNAVTVHFLVCQNTIDEFTLKTVQKKRMLSEAMLDETSIQQIGAEKARKMIAEMIGEKV